MTPMTLSPQARPTAQAIARRRRDLKIASFSDVHLGHPQTPTEHIIANLRREFPNTAETGELDLILLGGDLFDSGLTWTDKAVPEIEAWMLSFLKMCQDRKIVLRVLEGTPSHDRKQSQHFVKLIAQHGLTLDFKYVTEISVEWIEALEISLLYVPDFTSPDVDKIWMQVQQALAAAGRTTVDYANIHGGFSYQLPPISHVQQACHSMERYLSIVEQYIFSGHIHFPSVYERIYSNGSFDRLNHGEEGDKGHWRAHIRVSGEDDFVFKINRGAKIYRTLQLAGKTMEEVFLATEVAEKMPLGSAIRIEVERGHPLLTNTVSLKQGYPHIAWSFKALSATEAHKELLVDRRSAFTEITLTPANITSLLMDRVRAKATDPRVAARAETLLGDYR